MPDNEFEREIEALVLNLEAEREKLAKKADAARFALDTVEQKIATLHDTLRIYRETHHLPVDIEVDDALRRRLAGKSTREALVDVMRDRGGMISGKDACRVLLQAGMFKDFRNASSSVYSVFNRYPAQFEKVGRGRYKLAGIPQEIRPSGIPSEMIVPQPIVRTHKTQAETDKVIDDILSA